MIHLIRNCLLFISYELYLLRLLRQMGALSLLFDNLAKVTYYT